LVPRTQKKIFKKRKKIIARYSPNLYKSVVNFNMIEPFSTSLRCPKVLGQKGSQGPNNEDIEKNNNNSRQVFIQSLNPVFWSLSFQFL